ncbi:MAG: hypothetical protein HYZ29_03830, partial [Myxococcales bacterium]|nr:hypothetical protein [Myxococcales bacterium]
MLGNLRVLALSAVVLAAACSSVLGYDDVSFDGTGGGAQTGGSGSADAASGGAAGGGAGGASGGGAGGALGGA